LKKKMERKKKDRKTGFPGFLKYMENNLTGRDKNLFERELQKDPFAEEAEEGLSELSPDAVKEDMNNLSGRLERRTTGSRRIIIFRIAASVAVLMAVSSLFFLLHRPAEVRPSDKPVEMELSRAEPIKAEKDNEAFKEKPVHLNKEKTKTSGAGQAAVAGQIAENDLGKTTHDTLNKEEKEVPVINDSALKDSLNPSSLALNEVVVSGYTGKRAADRSLSTTGGNTQYTPPEPVNGKAGFDDYIQTNIREPEKFKAGKKAVVVLSFIVRNDGTPDSIKIVRSPGQQYSDEAVRLIKMGPKWKPATENGNPVEEEARVRIVFK
jgi:TonB family protein